MAQPGVWRQALDPALEGRDLRVVGVVTDMPQRNEAGLRFTLATDSATLDGRAVRVPARMDAGWYSGGFAGGSGDAPLPREVRAGERWSLTLRLKAPHGSRNPFGFDYEVVAVGARRAGHSLCARRQR